MKKKVKNKGKWNITGILLSVLFTLIVPIGFVFLMGMLCESFPVMYFYTKQIFLAFVVLVIAGICMIIYQIYRYMKHDKPKAEDMADKRRERRERREQRRAAEAIKASINHGTSASE